MARTSRSEDLKREVEAMAQIERAYAKLNDLPELQRARVRKWAAETYGSEAVVGGQEASSDAG